MAQTQNDIKVRMLDKSIRNGVSTGNNAAWMCVCKYKKPLVGRTGGSKPNSRNIIKCPNPKCKKIYYVYPEDGIPQKRVEYVQECNFP